MAGNFLNLAIAGALFSKKMKPSRQNKKLGAAVLGSVMLSSTITSFTNTVSASASASLNKSETQKNESSGFFSKIKSWVQPTLLAAGALTGAAMTAKHIIPSGFFGKIMSVVKPTASMLLTGATGVLGALKFILPLGKDAIQSWFFYKMYAQGFVQKIMPKKEFKMKSVVETKRQLDLLSNAIVGQSEAKRKIKNTIINMANTSQKGEKAKPVVFYFSGPTGCGKDHTIERLINPVFGGEKGDVFYFDGSCIDQNSETPVGKQVFGYHMIGGQSKNAQICISPVVSAIRNGCKVIVFDEFDKIVMKDGRTAAECMDETMRTILDKGKIYLPDSSELDCHGVVFCFTTNELPECLTKVNNFEKLDISKIKDPTGSHTVVRHDKSLLCRTNFVPIIMNQLKGEDLLTLCRDKLLDMMLDFKENYGIQLFHLGNFEKICREIAKEAEKRNEGARGVDKVINEMISPVVMQKAVLPFLSKVSNEGSTNEKDDENDESVSKVNIGLNFILSYNPEEGSFDCSLFQVSKKRIIPLDLDEDGNLLPPNEEKIIDLVKEKPKTSTTEKEGSLVVDEPPAPTQNKSEHHPESEGKPAPTPAPLPGPKR